MRYWLYLLAKVSVSLGVAWGVQAAFTYLYPKEAPPLARFGPAPPLFLHDMLFTFGTLGVWLLGAGLVYVSVLDSRRRCRTCLRKLIMPVASGSWGNMVIFGRPRIELICPYGHGTLSIEELQITGSQQPDWRPHDENIWKELESYHQAGK